MDNMLTFAHNNSDEGVRWLLALSLLVLTGCTSETCAGEQ